VVGIGYPDDPAFAERVLANRGTGSDSPSKIPPVVAAPGRERAYDLTLPATEAILASTALPGHPAFKSSNVGGLEDFLKTIETEVKPRVAALAHIDPTNQALFGHSFGGLATLHALFVEPNAFRTFLVSSPSVWWSNKAVLADEAKFAAAVTAGQAVPRVLVSMGSAESTVPANIPASWGIDRADLAASLKRARMVENGRELVTQLKAIHGGAGYVVEDYVIFDKSSHAAAQWPAMARGISFAFDGTPAGE
jgi:predicted alpha/beta superfamily hydrolase